MDLVDVEDQIELAAAQRRLEAAPKRWTRKWCLVDDDWATPACAAAPGRLEHDTLAVPVCPKCENEPRSCAECRGEI